MATRIILDHASSSFETLVFRFDDGTYFDVKSFNKGVLVIEPPKGVDIYYFAGKIAGCFEQGSNIQGIKAICFEFNEVPITVTAENAAPDRIVRMYWKLSEELRKKDKRFNRSLYMK